MARNRVTSGALGKSKKTRRIGSCSARRTGLREVHVLAVDDSIIDRKVIERLLTISSCKVTAVDSGRRALQFLGLEEQSSPAGSNASHPRNSECREIHEPDVNGLKVDLIITDYCMPGMTGFELLKKVKESSALREIPVVIVSSEKTSAHMDRCLQEGAEEFLVKPVKLSDVKRLRSYTNRGIQDRCSASRKRKRPDSHSPVSPELSLSLKSPPPAV